jgi:GNAT superfamily N-acetyltransferase
MTRNETAPAHSTTQSGQSPVTITRANIDQLDELIAIRDEATREMFALGPADDISLLMEQTATYYRRTLPTEEHIACLAMLDGAVVGCGGVCLQDELPAPTNPTGACAFVQNIYVRPAARHQGIASQMMSWLIDKAQAKGAIKVYLEASDSGAPLYSGLGFAPMAGMMRLQDEYVVAGAPMHRNAENA